MGTHLPHGLQKLLELTVGMPWPEGDENELQRLASAWKAVSADLGTLADDLLVSANRLAPVLRGDVGTRVHELLAVELRRNAAALKEQADVSAGMVRTAAADLQKSKIMIVGMLALLAATIAALLASLFGAFSIPSVIAAARVGIGALLRELLTRLLQVGLVNIAREIAIKAVIGGVVGVGFMVGLDAGIQGWQLAVGLRDHWDTASLKGSAIGGAIGGAFAGVAEGLVGVVGRAGRGLWERLPKSVRAFGPLGNTLFQIPAAALSNPVIGMSTKNPGSASEGLLGAFDRGGGKRTAKVPRFDLPELKPIGDLGLLPLALKNVAAPLPGSNGTPVGVTFGGPSADTPLSLRGNGTSSVPAPRASGSAPADLAATPVAVEWSRNTVAAQGETRPPDGSARSGLLGRARTALTDTGAEQAHESPRPQSERFSSDGPALGGTRVETESDPVSLSDFLSGTDEQEAAGHAAARHLERPLADVEDAGLVERGDPAFEASEFGNQLSVPAGATGAEKPGLQHAVESGEASGTARTTEQVRRAPDVVGDLSLSGRDPRTNASREFRSSDVEVTTLHRGEQVVGISFRQNKHLKADQKWARAEQGASRPWPDNTLFVSATGDKTRAILTLRGEGRVAVDGANLGRLLNDLQDFRSSVRAQRPEMFALLAAHSAERLYPSGLAREFQATLAGEFGHAQPVIAPSGRHKLVTSGGTASALLADGTQWRTFHLKPVLDDVVLRGLDVHTREAVVFRSSEVEVTRLERNGQTLGASFWPGEHRDADLAWASAPQSDHQLRSEPGSEPVAEPRPWPDATFLVSAPDAPTPDFALVGVRDRLVAVNGADLGKLVHDLRFFRSAVQAGRADALALLISHSSARTAPGGLAHDFQAALAGERGYRQPVFGQPQRVAKVMLSDGTAGVSATGAWHTHHKPTVIFDRSLVGTDGATGQMVRFRSSEVAAAPMEREGRVVGVTFRTGPDLSFDQRLGRAEQDSHTHLFQGEVAAAALVERREDSTRVSVPRPWPEETFYVSAHGRSDSALLRLADGTEVLVAGAEFARLLADLRFFQSAMYSAAPSAITMLVCSAGAIEGRGGVAHDFQAALARNSGHRQPVFAATQRVSAVLSANDHTVFTSVERGGSWRRFPSQGTEPALSGGWRRLSSPDAPVEIGWHRGGTARSEVLGDVALTGSRADGSGTRTFRTSEVLVTPLEREDRVIGASFTSGDDLHVDRTWAAARKSGETHHFAGAYDNALPHDETARTSRARPWPENAFYLAAHGDSASVDLLLSDGTRLKVDGNTFAGVLADLPFVTTALRHSEPDAAVLLVCQAAAKDGSGGVAHDFQRAMRDFLGHSLPVHAPSKDLWLAFHEGSAITAVVEGGGWRRYPAVGDGLVVAGESGARSPSRPESSAARPGYGTLARKAATEAEPLPSPRELPIYGHTKPDGNPRSFVASEVSVSPLERNGRVVGLTFSTGPARDEALGWARAGEPMHYAQSDGGPFDLAGPARDAFLVSAPGNEREVVVRLVDGTEVALDGQALGKLLIGLDLFRSAVRAGDPAELGLLVSRSAVLADHGGLARDFQAHLAEVLGYRQRVLAPLGTIETFAFGSDAVGTLNDGGWRTFSRPVVLSDVLLRGEHAGTDDMIVIRSSHVDVAPLIRNGTVAGVTFWTGPERDRALAWAARADEPEHHSISQDPGTEPVVLPISWPKPTFVISGPGDAREMRVRLSDGTEVKLDGETVGRLLNDLRFFRAVVDANRPAQFALLVSRSGTEAGVGGLAGDLQDTLAGDYGIRPPVVAPSGRMDTLDFGPGEPVATAIEEGSRWRTFAALTVSGDVPLYGQTVHSTTVSFRTSQVVAGPLDRDGEIIGVTFRTGGERRHELNSVRDKTDAELAGPWPGSRFFVSVPGTAHRAFLRLTDGTQVLVDGRTLGLVLEDLRFFRDTMVQHHLSAFVLLASRAGADRHPGGLAWDFQSVLASELGRGQPVVAPSQRLGWFVFDQLGAGHGGWKVFALPTVNENIGLHGFDRSGELMPFRSSEVDVSPLSHRGRVIGASFTTGQDRAFDLWWVGGDKAAETFLAPGRSVSGSEWRDPRMRTAIPTPWPERTFFVSAHGQDRLVEINLANGTYLKVSGEDFAQLLGDFRFFHAAMARERLEALTLLVCKVGATDGPGGAAHDFQAVLEERFGYHQPVFAGTDTVRLLDSRPATAAVMNGGVWRRFPAETPAPSSRSGGSERAGSHSEAGPAARVVDNVPLTSIARTPVAFRSSDVRMRLFEKDGRPVGISFTTGADLRTDAAVFDGKPLRHTRLMPAGVVREAQLVKAVREGRYESVPVPWPENSFFVSAHGKPGHFEVNLVNGATVKLDGTGFARLMHDLRGFREAVEQTAPDAIALLVCHTGRIADPGGASYEFQRALGEFGYRQPVVSATDEVVLRPGSHGQWGTEVANGGAWRTFSSGSAEVLGLDRAAEKIVAFRPEAVEAAPLERDGQVVGVSFLAEHDQAADRVAPPRGRQFVVQADALPDGRFAVRLADGRDMAVEAPAFARVVASSSSFRDAMGRTDSVLLVTSRAVGHQGRLPGGPPEFARVLALELGADLPVLDPDGRRLSDPVVRLPFGLDHSGALRRFEPGEVQFSVLSDGTRQIGVTFHSGLQRVHAEQWAKKSLNQREFTTIQPEGGDGLRHPRRDVAERVKAPWDTDALFISAPGGADSFTVRLADGAQVRVDGRNLAAVVASLDAFRQVADENLAGRVVLLSDHVGEVPGRGGAAHDFGRALAELGLRRPVVAPTTDVRLRMAVFGQSGDTALGRGGTWQVFPVAESIRGVELEGSDSATGGPIVFTSAQVMVSRAENRGGDLLGVSFVGGDDLRVNLNAARARLSGRTQIHLGDRPSGVAGAVSGAWSVPNPWPDNTFFVSAHADPTTFVIELADGRTVYVDGHAFGRLLHDLRPFREALAERAPEAITLVACSSGEWDTASGAARSFATALTRLGHALRVFAPTRTVQTDVGFGHAVMSIIDGGEWKEF